MCVTICDGSMNLRHLFNMNKNTQTLRKDKV